MRFTMLAILAGLTFITLWGLLSPRTQWRALAAFGRRDGQVEDPGTLTVTIHRVVSGLAIAVLVVLGYTTMFSDPQPVSAIVHRATNDPIRQLWGDPDPVVVDRVFPNLVQQPVGLVEVTATKYQIVSGPKRSPAYLFALADYSRPHPAKNDGYIGSDPSRGFSALDTADLVVQVVADSRCTPHQITVIERANAVVIGIYYGRPSGQSLTAAEQATPCDPAAPASKLTSVLIPVDLASPLAGREVYSPGGTVIARAVSSTPAPDPTPSAPAPNVSTPSTPKK